MMENKTLEKIAVMSIFMLVCTVVIVGANYGIKLVKSLSLFQEPDVCYYNNIEWDGDYFSYYVSAKVINNTNKDLLFVGGSKFKYDNGQTQWKVKDYIVEKHTTRVIKFYSNYGSYEPISSEIQQASYKYLGDSRRDMFDRQFAK